MDHGGIHNTSMDGLDLFMVNAEWVKKIIDPM
jgi:hypothetical protein